MTIFFGLISFFLSFIIIWRFGTGVKSFLTILLLALTISVVFIALTKSGFFNQEYVKSPYWHENPCIILSNKFDNHEKNWKILQSVFIYSLIAISSIIFIGIYNLIKYFHKLR